MVGNAGHLLRRASGRRLLPDKGGSWLVLPLGRSTDELPASPLPFAGEPTLALLDALRCLATAAHDERVDGVVLRFRGGLSGWSKALALRRAVDELREAGKAVVAWGETFSAEEYLVASGADRVWLPESGNLLLVGVLVEQFFLRELLERFEVQPEVVRVGGYKTAAELLTHSEMSPEQREQIESWLDDLYSELVAGIARGRGLDPQRVRERIDCGPYPAASAIESGLIDGCLYPDQLPDALQEFASLPRGGRDGPRRVRLVEAIPYFRWVVADPGWRPLRTDLPRIAYVVASGPIHRGAGSRGIASESYRHLLDDLAQEKGVRGVVLRVDSPGGDAIASDLLFRAIGQLSREKPVIVSMGDVAASGGYYLAAAADCVYAEAGTLTGSIGVVGGKLNLAGLYRRLGVAKGSVERGARAGMLSEARGFTPDEYEALRGGMQAVYETFLARVATGRKLSLEAVGRLAQGRIWSGLRAKSLGLVDAIGGPLEALQEACRRAGLVAGERFVLEFHPRRRRLGLARLLGTALQALGFGGSGRLGGRGPWLGG
ncbi:MAG: signal peptide peptidase SppA [Myxococcota bacterium]